MTRFPIILICLFFLASCGGANQNNNESENYNEDIGAKNQFFQNVFNDDQIAEQKFLIQADRDTLLVADNGTQFRIFANTFSDLNGNDVDG